MTAAGGSRRALPGPTARVAAALLVATGAAVVAGPVPFAVLVLALSALLLVDLTAVLADAGPRPVILVAAVPGIGLPVTVLALPEAAWTTIPTIVAVGLLATFVTVLVSGRRRDVTGALGSTVLAGLVVGLGGSGLLLLASLADGPRWVLAVVVVVALVQVVRRVASARAQPLTAAGATVGTALLAAGVLAVIGQPFSMASAAGVAALALLGGSAAGLLGDAADGGATGDATQGPVLPRHGLVGLLAATAMPVLLAAPGAYTLARVAVL